MSRQRTILGITGIAAALVAVAGVLQMSTSLSSPQMRAAADGRDVLSDKDDDSPMGKDEDSPMGKDEDSPMGKDEDSPMGKDVDSPMGKETADSLTKKDSLGNPFPQ